ncbi:hypothetical protein EZS27_023098 [termite gut metagenome]|uniref:Uncharacterized protein n=1 Tax=termite gut metagenome TaxID=433724 RepID=A0A5J4R3N5_9ZZZZ
MSFFQHTEFIPIVTMIASMATVLYSIIAFRTLFEMKKQRENTYRPELITTKTRFALIKYESDIIGTEKFITITKDIKRKDIPSYKIPLYNIGLGTAKDIKTSFEFPYEKSIEIIKKMYEDLNIKFEKKIEWRKDDNDNFVLVTDKTQFHTWSMEENYDYLMPISQEKVNGYVHIPPCIDFLLFSYCEAELATDKHLNTFPDFYLNIEYSDIASKKHLKRVKLKFNPTGIASDFVLGYISSITN